MSVEPTLADLKRQADALRCKKNAQKTKSTNKTVQSVLSQMEQSTGTVFDFAGHLSDDVIKVLAKLGIKASHIPMNCDCDPRESCRQCEGGPLTRVELGPRPYEEVGKWGVD